MRKEKVRPISFEDHNGHTEKMPFSIGGEKSSMSWTSRIYLSSVMGFYFTPLHIEQNCFVIEGKISFCL